MLRTLLERTNLSAKFMVNSASIHGIKEGIAIVSVLGDMIEGYLIVVSGLLILTPKASNNCRNSTWYEGVRVSTEG